MAEEKTRLVLEGEVRGFDKVQQVVDEVVGAVEGGGGNPGVISALDKALAGIADSLDKIEQAVDGVAKAAGALKDSADGGGRGSSKTASKDEKAEPSFLRGMLQGFGIAQYMPGMTPQALIRQAAGVTAGRSLHGIGGGLGRSAFTGIQGLSSAFGAIPGVGGTAEGMAQAAIAAVEDALELQRANLDAAPFLNRRLGSQSASDAMEGINKRGPRFLLDPSRLHRPQMHANPDRPQTIEVFNHETGRLELRHLYPNKNPSLADLKAADEAAIGASGARFQTAEELRREAESASGSARENAIFGAGFEGLGVRYGRDRTELTRDLAELMQARGGFHDPGGGGLAGALAGRAGFGVGLGTSGALLRGMRTGGIAGSGDEGDQLAKLIGDGLRMGLEGSELVEHLQRMADGVKRFEMTGIPIAAASIESVAGTLMGSGMSNGVAAMRSSLFAQSIQQRAGEGLPGTAVDFASLVHLGGYAGGGTEEALAARARLARGDFKQGGIDELTKLFGGQLGTGEFGRAFGVEQGFKRLGLSLNPDEAMALDARSRLGPDQLSKAQRAAIARAEGRFRSGFSGLAGLEDEASGAVGGGLQSQANIRNVRRAAGEQALDVVQEFEKRAAIASQAFAAIIDKAKLLAPILDALVDGFGEAVRVTTGKVVVKSGQ